jgi:hypothetical protein
MGYVLCRLGQKQPNECHYHLHGIEFVSLSVPGHFIHWSPQDYHPLGCDALSLDNAVRFQPVPSEYILSTLLLDQSDFNPQK